VLVGEAHIMVRAITTKVADDIKNGFKGVDNSVGSKAGRNLGKSFYSGFNSSGSTNIFGRISDGLQSLAPDADAARLAFQGFTRKSYYLTTGLSLLFGSIASVIGGLVALAGSAAGAVPSFVSMLNVMVGLKIGMGVAKLALGGVSDAVQAATQLNKQYGSVAAAVGQQMKQLAFDAEAAALSERRAGLSLEQARENLLAAQQLPPNSRARREAELAYEEADLAYRRAQEQQKQADIAKKRGAKGGANDPYASLTKSQIKFANFLMTFQGQLKKLKEAAASGFLPLLQTQIQRLNATYFPVLIDGFKSIGTSVGKATKSITDMLTKAENVKKVENIFGGSSVVIEKVGIILSGLFDGFLTILNAARPITEKFLNFLIEKITDFNNLLKSNNLEAFFTRSGEIAADFGEIFGNVFGGLGAIVQANFGPDSGGQYLLDWLKEATGDWETLNKSPEGQKKLKKYFQDVAVNAKVILQTVGAFFSELSGIGSDPNIAKTFKIIEKAAPYVGQVFKDSLAAGPAFGAAIVELARFIATMTDAEAPKIFFDTLTGAFKILNDVLNTDIGKKVLEIHGRIIAVVLAFGVMTGSARFFKKVAISAFKSVTDTISNMIDGAKSVVKYFQPGGGFDGVRLRAMYAKDALVKAKDAVVDFGKKAIDAAKSGGSAMINWGKDIGRYVVGNVKKAASAIAEVSKKLVLNTIELGKNIAAWVAQKVQIVASAVALGVQKAAQVLATAATAVATGIQTAFNFVLGLNPMIFLAIAIAAVVTALVLFFTQTEDGKRMWAAFTDFLVDSWNNILDFFAGMGRWFADLWGGIVDGVQAAWNGIGDFFTGLINGFIGTFEGFVNFVIDGINLLLENVNGGLGFLGDLIGQDLEISLIPNVTLPRLAKGGVVSPSAGGSLVNVAEAGKPERIEPLDENGLSKRDKALMASRPAYGGDIVININGTDLDKNELAAEMSRRLAFVMRRGSTA
jgi:hypothetical protein